MEWIKAHDRDGGFEPTGKDIGARLGAGWRRAADPAWVEGWEPRRFELARGTTEVVALGDGPSVLLIPPLPGFKEAWVACWSALARSFRVITFDLGVRRGGRPRWEDLLQDLDRIADRLAPGPVGVVGHSLGGALAQRWALLRPERVKALVLSSSFARVHTPASHWHLRFVEQPIVLASQRLLPRALALPLARSLAARGAWVYDPKCDERILDFVRFCIRDVSMVEVQASLRLAFDHRTPNMLPGLACPTLVVVGEREALFARRASEELARLIPAAELAVSPGTSHLHPLSGAAWFVDRVGGWLSSRLETPGRASPVPESPGARRVGAD